MDRFIILILISLQNDWKEMVFQDLRMSLTWLLGFKFWIKMKESATAEFNIYQKIQNFLMEAPLVLKPLGAKWAFLQ